MCLIWKVKQYIYATMLYNIYSVLVPKLGKWYRKTHCYWPQGILKNMRIMLKIKFMHVIYHWLPPWTLERQRRIARNKNNQNGNQYMSERQIFDWIRFKFQYFIWHTSINTYLENFFYVLFSNGLVHYEELKNTLFDFSSANM